MAIKRPCAFCGIAQQIGDYCPNCQKFFTVIEDQQRYMMELGLEQLTSLQTYFRGKVMILQAMITHKEKKANELKINPLAGTRQSHR